MKKKHQGSKVTAEEVIKSRRNKILDRRGWGELGVRLAGLILVFYHHCTQVKN